MGWLWDNIIQPLLNALGTAIGGVVDWILSNTLGVPLRALLKSLAQTGVDIYNTFVQDAVDVLTQDPTTIANGQLWSVIEPINSALVAVGSMLVVLFFLIDFCSSSLDVRDNVRLETIFKTSIKLIIAEYFVTNNITVIKGLIAIGDGIVDIIAGSSSATKVTLSQTFLNSVDKYDFWTTLLGVIIWLIVALAMIGSGAIIMYYAYQRAIKLLVIVPFGAIAFSTIAGGHQINHTTISFVKFVLATMLEAGAIIIVLILMGKLISVGGIGSISTTQAFASDISGALKAGVSYALSCLLTVGMVKGCLSTIERGLGL